MAVLSEGLGGWRGGGGVKRSGFNSYSISFHEIEVEKWNSCSSTHQ